MFKKIRDFFDIVALKRTNKKLEFTFENNRIQLTAICRYLAELENDIRLLNNRISELKQEPIIIEVESNRDMSELMKQNEVIK